MIQHAHSLAHSMPPLYFPFSFETRTLDMQSCGAVIQHYTNACTLTTSLWILRLPVCSCIKLPAPLTHTHTLQVLEQYENLWFCYLSLVLMRACCALFVHQILSHPHSHA